MNEPNELQRWILAVGAPLHRRNGRRLDRLGGDGRPTISWEASSVLRNGWRVQSSADAARSVSWLLDGGHRAQYARAGLGTEQSFVGWDASRAANVAGWAYAAYLVDLETAWAWHLRAAALVRSSFGSWAELGQSYLRGLSTWSEGDRTVLDPSEQAVAWLTSDPSSPWLALPFACDVAAVPPPDLSPHEVVVGRDAPTIAAAITLAGPDGRVSIPSGTYRELIAPAHGIELVGDGEVILESAGVPCVRIEKTVGALLRGLTLRSALTETGSSLNAIRVTRGYVRLESCDVAATHDGLQLATWAAAHVLASRIHDCGMTGVNVLGGQLILEASEVCGARGEGIKLGGEAPSLVLESSIHDNGLAGVLVHEKNAAKILGTEIAGNGGSASVIVIGTASLTIDGSTIARGKGGGVFFHGESSGLVRRTRIEACALAGLDVGSTGGVKADDVVITAHPTSGVLVRGGGRLVLTNARLDASEQGHVWVMAEGRAALASCRIVGGGLALWVQGGGEALVHDTRFEDQTGPAIDAQPGAKIATSLLHVSGASGDGATLGAGADVRCVLGSFVRIGGAGIRAAEGASASLEGVVLDQCAGGDIAGVVSRSDVVGPVEARASQAHRDFDAFVSSLLR